MDYKFQSSHILANRFKSRSVKIDLILGKTKVVVLYGNIEPDLGIYYITNNLTDTSIPIL
jgi:hypothetical protein